MASGKFDFANRGSKRRACEQGATFDRSVVWKDNDGSVIDLTGYTAVLKVRATAESSTVILEMSTTNGTILASDEGLQLVLEPSATESITPGTYVYDLTIANPSGEKRRLIEGLFEISAQVSR